MQYSNICYVDYVMALKELFPFGLSEDAVALASENSNWHFNYLDLHDTINECFSYWIEDYLLVSILDSIDRVYEAIFHECGRVLILR